MRQTKAMKIRKEILQRRIFKLAEMYVSREVSPENAAFHNRVVKLQCICIREKHSL